jgi:hypothetical protein
VLRSTVMYNDKYMKKYSKISNRLKIAKLLIEGKTYQEIQSILKVGFGTVSKVNQWLLESGEGFRVIAKRTKKKKEKKPRDWKILNPAAGIEEWNKFKKRYPIMFWPQLLMEDIIKAMDKKQKDKIRRTVEKLDRKSDIYKQLNKILN